MGNLAVRGLDVTMQLKTLKIKNFRSFLEETVVPISDFTALIGKNEAGKSSLLEALEIFFNSSLVKIDEYDRPATSDSANAEITCVFSDLPERLSLDDTSETSLSQEYLLNEDGDLEVKKVFNLATKSPKASTYVIAKHPSAASVTDLLLLKNTELKLRLASLQVDSDDVDLRNNSKIRQAIWQSQTELLLQRKEIPVEKEDAKAIWISLSKYMPMYALFQSDRKSTHEDREVQDPMDFAIAEAVKEMEGQLETVKAAVERKVLELATKTLEKLKEMDPALADDLTPRFKSEPKWQSLFKLSLDDHDQIPIDKRGSGTRRLILLNFFRADAERRMLNAKAPAVIFAVEEPETAQHPNNQRLLVEALLNLSEAPNSQVIVTTHVPALAGLVPLESLRFLDRAASNRIAFGADTTYQQIADTLGLLPDKRVQVVVCVEGPTDILFLKAIGRILRTDDASLPDLDGDPRIAIIPLGGSTLKDWVGQNYLKSLGVSEVHLYDRDTENPPKYQETCRQVNARSGNHFAVLTIKREIENYLHSDAIFESLGVRVTFGDTDDVPLLVAEQLHISDASAKAWNLVSSEDVKKKSSRAKRRLNQESVNKMSRTRLEQRDPSKEVESWLRKIADRLTN
ncbi:MAG: ATP-binding protein [Candidatus Obscuribacterales bacterium]|nr:ATP-binding protein [Candidatus Obscuribacterales bacterium]